jgi:CRP-like cAMP-binding protein/Fe-S-cluster-containing hydrogenase component 2
VPGLRNLPFTDDLRARLTQNSLLARIDAADLAEGLSACRVLGLPTGFRIIQQGEYDDRFFILIEGRCDVLSADGSGETSETRLGSLNTGDFFGEMSCMSPWPRSSSIIASTSCTVLEIPDDVFDDWFDSSEGFKEVMEASYMSRGLVVLLRHLDAFSALGNRSLNHLLEGATVHTHVKGTPIVTQGEPGDAFYVIRGGVVAVEMTIGEVTKTVSYHRAGSFFGEMALLDGTPRTATVRATNKTEVIRIDREHFLEVLGDNPIAAQQLRDIVSERISAAENLLAQGAQSDALDFMSAQGILGGSDVLVLDLKKCTYCDNCVDACANAHNGVSLITLSGPTYTRSLFPTACRNCDDPMCLKKCPVDAIVRDRTGEVVIKEHCMGCTGCAVNCPYDTITMMPVSESRSDAAQLIGDLKREVTQQAVKCDLCAGIDGGPQCVANCPTSAILRMAPNQLVQHVLETTK